MQAQDFRIKMLLFQIFRQNFLLLKTILTDIPLDDANVHEIASCR